MLALAESLEQPCPSGWAGERSSGLHELLTPLMLANEHAAALGESTGELVSDNCGVVLWRRVCLLDPRKILFEPREFAPEVRGALLEFGCWAA